MKENEITSLLELSEAGDCKAVEAALKPNLAWLFSHDDDVSVNREKFRSYLEASALLGHESVQRDPAIQVELGNGWRGFAEPFESAEELGPYGPKCLASHAPEG